MTRPFLPTPPTEPPAQPAPPALPSPAALSFTTGITPYLLDRIKTDVRAMISKCDPTPTALARVAPCLLALLTGGNRTRASAPAAWAKVSAALDAMPDPHATAVRVLLGIGLPPRTTLLDRRTRAAELYDLSAGHWAKTWEGPVIDMLVDALAQRADPGATLPTPPQRLAARLRTPPPLIYAVRATRRRRGTPRS